MEMKACSILNCSNRCAACNAVIVTLGSAMSCFSQNNPVQQTKAEELQNIKMDKESLLRKFHARKNKNEN